MTRLALPQVALPRPLPYFRVATAALLLGAAFAGAAVLHGYRVRQVYACPPNAIKCYFFSHLVRPGWVDPVSLGIVLLGLAAAACVIGGRPVLRLTGAALILVAAVAGAVALSTHRVLGAEHSCPRTAGYACFYHPRPGWVVPAMAGLVVLGLAGAAGTLAATRPRST